MCTFHTNSDFQGILLISFTNTVRSLRSSTISSSALRNYGEDFSRVFEQQSSVCVQRVCDSHLQQWWPGVNIIHGQIRKSISLQFCAIICDQFAIFATISLASLWFMPIVYIAFLYSVVIPGVLILMLSDSHSGVSWGWSLTCAMGFWCLGCQHRHRARANQNVTIGRTHNCRCALCKLSCISRVEILTCCWERERIQNRKVHSWNGTDGRYGWQCSQNWKAVARFNTQAILACRRSLQRLAHLIVSTERILQAVLDRPTGKATIPTHCRHTWYFGTNDLLSTYNLSHYLHTILAWTSALLFAVRWEEYVSWSPPVSQALSSYFKPWKTRRVPYMGDRLAGAKVYMAQRESINLSIPSARSFIHMLSNASSVDAVLPRFQKRFNVKDAEFLLIVPEHIWVMENARGILYNENQQKEAPLNKSSPPH